MSMINWEAIKDKITLTTVGTRTNSDRPTFVLGFLLFTYFNDKMITFSWFTVNTDNRPN